MDCSKQNINKPDVSVIVPVYNSQDYLRTTVESILAQSFTNFELLLIDDGSTDDSSVICDHLAEQDCRIRVVHRENKGMCAARNYALSIANGKYVTFCDNDDLYLNDLLKDNFILAEKYEADTVRFLRELQRLENNKEISKSVTTDVGNHLLTKKNIADNYDILRSIGGGVWNGLYRKDFLKKHNILFDESMRSGMEDLDFNLKVYASLEKLYINSKVYYLWIQRDEHSTSRKFTMNYLESLFICARRERRLINNYKISRSLWWKVLTETYIYNIINSFLIPNCPLSWSEKRSILNRFRSDILFDEEISKKDLKVFKKKSKKIYIAFVLFLKRKMNFLYFLIKMQQKLYKQNS
ncbi:glycosyltransferase family 2 protein [Enterococcus avium]|uniref:glycosyltransferase family 2 protein n=1 Tax=Enterococcus avium TaxID=33945 RepID=UPI003D12E14B